MKIKVLMCDPPYEEISKYLSYCELTGKLFWIKAPSNKIKIGALAGSLKSTGYWSIHWKGRNYLAHRIAWLLYYKTSCQNFIDHIDGDKLNNKIKNLREATKSENNFYKVFSQKSYRGVSWKASHNKWRARIKKDGKEIFIGYFNSPEEASLAFNQSASHLYGEFYKEEFCQ